MGRAEFEEQVRKGALRKDNEISRERREKRLGYWEGRGRIFKRARKSEAMSSVIEQSSNCRKLEIAGTSGYHQ